MRHEVNNLESSVLVQELEFAINRALYGVTRTVARTVMCHQDGRGRFPVCWTITPNVGQTHKENTNLVIILYMICTLNDIYKQYNKLHEH